ncbi:hypothetical protein HK405_004837, partial [Cladochytrium tenue]
MALPSTTSPLRRALSAALPAAALATLAALAAAPGPAAASSAGVWQYWSYPSTDGGYYNVDQNVTVSQTASTRFFSHQIWFNGGDAAYIGIQNNPNGTLAVFSVWNSLDAISGGPGSYCLPFDGEGVGRSCRIAYPWSVGTTYRLRIWATSTTDGKSQFVGAVQDTSTGIDTILGYISNAAGQGWISSSVSWIEDYYLNTAGTNCSTENNAQATFSYPTYDAGTGTASAGSSQTT